MIMHNIRIIEGKNINNYWFQEKISKVELETEK